MGKDYYGILGVKKEASADEIKQAFRKLAHQYHPDKATGDEKKFKEINEAYQVVGNEEKRKQYDQFGSTFDQQGGFGGNASWDDFMRAARGGQGGSANFDFGDLGGLGDIFGEMFGFGGSRSRGEAGNRGGDIQMTITIDFRESVFGAQKELEIYRNSKCDTCRGNGAEPGTPIVTCATCKGSGRVVRIQRTMFGNFQAAAVCTDCSGVGKRSEKPCHKCGGVGLMKSTSRLEVNIPAGVEDGMTLRLQGQGNAGSLGGRDGDLYLVIGVKRDKNFDREGADLFTDKKISFTTAILGGSVDVETLDGTVSLKIPDGTQPNTKFRIRDKGVPTNRGRGDLYVNIEVEIPKKLSRSQRQLLEKFEDS